MRITRTAIIILFLLLLCACGSTTSTDDSIEPSYSNSTEDASIPVIYSDDDKINAFLVAYNEVYPNDAITADSISKYYHHGQEHDSQIKAQIAGYPVIISSEYKSSSRFSISVYWDNPTPAQGDGNHELFRIIEHVLLPDFTESDIEARWEEIIKKDGVVESWDDGTEIHCGYGNRDNLGSYIYIKLIG